MKNTFRTLASLLLSCLCLLLPVTHSAAEEGGRASGSFETTGSAMEVKDAYAFYGTPSLGGKGKVIVVAVSNQGFVKEALDLYWDRRNALERYFKDERTGLVYFEFGPDGGYLGLSYYFGPNDGCAYCADPSVQSTVSLQGGRLTGKLSFPKGGDGHRWFDISLDVPVSDDDHGKSQGAGGGEPGKAYLAYHRALGGWDRRALRSLLSEERRSAWDKAEAEGKGNSFLSFLQQGHPREVKVTAAYVKGDRALLLIEGKGETGKVRGEVHFSREQGSWRFDEETLSPVIK